MMKDLVFDPYTTDEIEAWYRRAVRHELPEVSLYRDFYAPVTNPHGSSFLEAGYGPPGGYVKDFTMVHDGRAWHLFHIDGRPGEQCNVDGNEISFGHASTGDLQRWARHSCPLAVGNHAEWDSRHVMAPFVIRHPQTEEWLMFYMGVSQTEPHHSAIGRAVSQDLLFWTKDGDGTLYRPGAWSTRSCRDPHVFRYDNGFGMITTTNTVDGAGALALAFSSDLLHWEDKEPLRVFKDEGWTPESAGVMPFQDGWLCWVSACTVEGTIPLYLTWAPSLEGLRDAPMTAVRGMGPRAIAMEVLHCGPNGWLVAYFARLDIHNFRLFFGILDLQDVRQPLLTAVTRPGQLAAYREQAADEGRRSCMR